MSLFEPRTPVYGGGGEELEKVQRLLNDHKIPYKLKREQQYTRVFVKRSLADKSEMLILEARDRRWLW